MTLRLKIILLTIFLSVRVFVMSKRVALYTRVSTTDGQTVENQLRDLRLAGERLGWNIVATFADEGISGAKGREKRAGLDALMKGIARKGFDMVASWSICRLGRLPVIFSKKLEREASIILTTTSDCGTVRRYFTAVRHRHQRFNGESLYACTFHRSRGRRRAHRFDASLRFGSLSNYGFAERARA